MALMHFDIIYNFLIRLESEDEKRPSFLVSCVFSLIVHLLFRFSLEEDR